MHKHTTDALTNNNNVDGGVGERLKTWAIRGLTARTGHSPDGLAGQPGGSPLDSELVWLLSLRGFASAALSPHKSRTCGSRSPSSGTQPMVFSWWLATSLGGKGTTLFHAPSITSSDFSNHARGGWWKDCAEKGASIADPAPHHLGARHGEKQLLSHSAVPHATFCMVASRSTQIPEWTLCGPKVSLSCTQGS